MFIYSPWNLYGLLTSIHTLLLVYWPSHGIAIDHSSIGLKRLTILTVQLGLTVCFGQVFTSQYVTSVYSNLKVYSTQVQGNAKPKSTNLIWRNPFMIEQWCHPTLFRRSLSVTVNQHYQQLVSICCDSGKLQSWLKVNIYLLIRGVCLSRLFTHAINGKATSKYYFGLYL